MTKIAVTGGRGRLGSWLVASGCTPLICDIADEREVVGALEAVKPLVLINCAAYTRVDDAEDDIDGPVRANVRGPFVLRRNFDGYLVHISSGYIFDGASGPYAETDEPAPISRYGWTKLGGEAALAVGGPNLIIRVLDLFGPGPKTDFVRQVRDVIGLNHPLALPTNLYGTPTYIPHLAEAILVAVTRGLEGVLNLGGDATMSRFAWGRHIAQAFGHDPALIEPTNEVKGKARRPLRGGLMIERARALGLPIYAAEDGLRRLEEDARSVQ